MSYLIRIGVGNFNLEDSYSFDYIKSLDKDKLKSIICPIDKSIGHIDSLVVEDRFYNGLINGNIIPFANDIFSLSQTDKPARVYCKILL